MTPAEAHQRIGAYLEQFDLAEHKTKKVKELSKGMQQKAQVIATILHKPDLVIVDEPFAALDPVNTQLIKDVLREMRRDGAAILMSTHQMHQVEELCDRIVLIDHGRNVLDGTVTDVQRRFAGHAVLVRAGLIPMLGAGRPIAGPVMVQAAGTLSPGAAALFSMSARGNRPRVPQATRGRRFPS